MAGLFFSALHVPGFVLGGLAALSLQHEEARGEESGGEDDESDEGSLSCGSTLRLYKV